MERGHLFAVSGWYGPSADKEDGNGILVRLDPAGPHHPDSLFLSWQF
jgi:hypothetical protein